MLYIRYLTCLIVITCGLFFECKKPKIIQIAQHQPIISVSCNYSTPELLSIIDDKPLCLQTELNYSPTVDKFNNVPFSTNEIIAEATIHNYFDEKDKKLLNNTSILNVLSTTTLDKSLSNLEKLFLGKNNSFTTNNKHTLLATWYNNKKIIDKQYISANTNEILDHKSVKIWLHNYPLNKFLIFEKQSNSYELDKFLEQIVAQKLKSMPIGSFYVKIKPNTFK